MGAGLTRETPATRPCTSPPAGLRPQALTGAGPRRTQPTRPQRLRPQAPRTPRPRTTQNSSRKDRNTSSRTPTPSPGPRKTQAAETATPPAAHPHQRPAAGPRAFRPKGRSASGRRATQCVQAQDRIAASSRTARSAPSHTADGRVGCCRANADLQAAQKGPRRGVIGPRGT